TSIVPAIITMKTEVSMPTQRFAVSFLVFLALLGGCTKSDPQAALEAAVQQLQDNLEAKKASTLMEQLHPQLSAQQQYDSEWAGRTMALLFLRHNQVKVLALSQSSNIDPTYSSK